MRVALVISGLEVARPAQVKALVFIDMHQSQHERFAGGWVSGDYFPSEPWASIALDVDVQLGTRACLVYHQMAEVCRNNRAFAVSTERARCCASAEVAATSN